MRQFWCSFLNAWENTQVARAMTSVFLQNTRWRHGRTRDETKYSVFCIDTSHIMSVYTSNFVQWHQCVTKWIWSWLSCLSIHAIKVELRFVVCVNTALRQSPIYALSSLHRDRRIVYIYGSLTKRGYLHSTALCAHCTTPNQMCVWNDTLQNVLRYKISASHVNAAQIRHWTKFVDWE